MIILSKGYKKPETGDFGSTWFPALEDNIDLSNSHDHNGTNGEKIKGENLTVTSQSVLAAAFTLQSPGIYRATVTVPVGVDMDKIVPTCCSK